MKWNQIKNKKRNNWFFSKNKIDIPLPKLTKRKRENPMKFERK